MRKLLIVEDESDFVIMLGPQAKSRGFVCEIDMKGSECISKAIAFKPEAILLDMNLPDISGLGLIQEIRNHKDIAHIPIIVLSALNQSDVVNEAMNRGANAYFAKGCPISELFETINEYTMASRTSEQHA